ncbi:hypothetical protein [Streptococcus thoraltensis]|uniref:hypothetical protein n=1 Tax=Streptococcus thoraltensis TaxID=55085 RepID=UPI000372EADA|nr:hypothetical protein [Streptococcus thoraltensis]MDY4760487.1 hypothetical protein [Streptococcus thoraltensis]
MEKYSKDIIDMKFDNVEQGSINHYKLLQQRFDLLDKKIDNLVNYDLAQTHAMLLEQRIKEKQEREAEWRITKRWLIGISVIIAIVFLEKLLLK